MQQISTLLMFACVNQVTQSKPINNGFTLKFGPFSAKEVVKPKSFGALFAKITKHSTLDDNIQREIISKAYSHTLENGTGGTKHNVLKIQLPVKNNINENKSLDGNFLNIPIIQQPFNDYRVLVATAPSNIKLSGAEAKPLVVYVVFPEDEAPDARSINIPAIYFARKPGGPLDSNKLEKIDPVLIIDSNRTVTGLKSAEVAKFVRFKNKMTTRYNYEVTQR